MLTLATCPACSGAKPDWVAIATAFLEGKPINDKPSGLNGPQQARFIDAQIDSKKNPSRASNAANNTAVTPTHNSTPMFEIDLNDIRAVPNPANLSDQVKINATSNNLSTSTSLTNMIVYVSIKNSVGTEIGKVNLKRTSGNDYAGIWNAKVESGTYTATIDASGSGSSKMFNDALQIAVSSSKVPPAPVMLFEN